MTDQRGPDFLPYPLPDRPVAPVHVAPPTAPPPGKGRWSQAVDALPATGVVAIGTGLAAFFLLLLLSLAADQPGAGAVVIALVAAVSLVTGWAALKPTVPKDSRTLIVSAQSLAAACALLAIGIYAAGGADEQPPVSVPSPQPSASSSVPAPAPTPTPEVSPGAVNGFGVPSVPGQPQSDNPTDLGTLLGHVVDTAGKPVEGALVTVTRATAGDTSSTPDCPVSVTTRTDSQGGYRFQLCQLGEGLGYRVTIAVGTLKAGASLFVNSGQTTVYDVILPR